MVFVTLPFTDQRTMKRRPAVVVSSERYHQERPDLIILAVTSQVRTAPAVGEAAIGKWKAAELLKPSIRKPLLAAVSPAPAVGQDRTRGKQGGLTDQ